MTQGIATRCNPLGLFLSEFFFSIALAPRITVSKDVYCNIHRVRCFSWRLAELTTHYTNEKSGRGFAIDSTGWLTVLRKHVLNTEKPVKRRRFPVSSSDKTWRHRTDRMPRETNVFHHPPVIPFHLSYELSSRSILLCMTCRYVACPMFALSLHSMENAKSKARIIR